MSKITRDADFPVEAAQLVAAFNRCADGHDMEHVVQAAGNFLSAAMHNYARAKNMGALKAVNFFTEVLSLTQANAEMNFARAGEKKPGDVIVGQN